MSIVVTGATGHLGHLVVEQLLARGVAPDEVLATGRSLEKVADLSARGVRTARLDFADPAGVLERGDVLLLVSTDVAGVRVPLHRAVIDAAVAAGVARIVYTSAPRADDTTLILAPEHQATEELVVASGLPYTILRNNWYTENYAGTVAQARATGEVVGNAGAGRVASATRADYAEATAVVLTTAGHENAVYELGGDTAWDFPELAAAIGTVLGREVRWVPVTAEEHQARLRAAGLDEGTAAFVTALDTNIAEGALAEVTHTLSKLTGHPTTPLVDALRPLAG
jgi:NAD(P)H dehydrogenase (quinone)